MQHCTKWKPGGLCKSMEGDIFLQRQYGSSATAPLNRLAKFANFARARSQAERALSGSFATFSSIVSIFFHLFLIGVPQLQSRLSLLLRTLTGKWSTKIRNSFTHSIIDLSEQRCRAYTVMREGRRNSPPERCGGNVCKKLCRLPWRLFRVALSDERWGG